MPREVSRPQQYRVPLFRSSASFFPREEHNASVLLSMMRCLGFCFRSQFCPLECEKGGPRYIVSVLLCYVTRVFFVLQCDQFILNESIVRPMRPRQMNQFMTTQCRSHFQFHPNSGRGCVFLSKGVSRPGCAGASGGVGWASFWVTASVPHASIGFS